MQPIRIFAGVFAVFSLLLLTPTTALAFKLNPCLRVLTYEPGKLDEQRIRFFNLCSLASDNLKMLVHEHMTNFAIDEYRGTGFVQNYRADPEKYATVTQTLNFMEQPRWPDDSKRHRTSDLIYGTWWNDDPLMYLWGQGRDFRQGLFTFKTVLDSPLVETFEGGVANCRVPRQELLMWRSHFGSLQYLHFMTRLTTESRPEERVNNTVEKSLKWIEFAYGVASKQIKPDTVISTQQELDLGLPSLRRNYCLQQSENGKVRTLFARVGIKEDGASTERESIAARDRMTPDVALGSIFHLLQDSFSPAHTCRVAEVGDDGRGQIAALRDVFNYNEQDHKAHGEQDVFPPSVLTYARTGTHLYENDPIVLGAWLLDAVDHELPWDKVKTHLLETVFRPTHSAPPDAPCIKG